MINPKSDPIADRVDQALQALKRSKRVINFSMVAEKARIARKTIYNRPDLKLKVQQAIEAQVRKLNPKEEIAQSKPISIQEQRIQRYQEEIKNLSQQKEKLLYQNVLLTDEVTTLIRRIFELEEYIHSKGPVPLELAGKV